VANVRPVPGEAGVLEDGRGGDAAVVVWPGDRGGRSRGCDTPVGAVWEDATNGRGKRIGTEVGVEKPVWSGIVEHEGDGRAGVGGDDVVVPPSADVLDTFGGERMVS